MKTLTFKVTEDEDRAIRSQARREGLSVSEILRRKVRVGGASGALLKVVRSKRTGAPVFLGTPDMPPLTVDTVREMLGEFP